MWIESTWSIMVSESLSTSGGELVHRRHHDAACRRDIRTRKRIQLPLQELSFSLAWISIYSSLLHTHLTSLLLPTLVFLKLCSHNLSFLFCLSISILDHAILFWLYVDSKTVRTDLDNFEVWFLFLKAYIFVYHFSFFFERL